MVISDLTPYIYWLTKKQKNFIIKSRKKRHFKRKLSPNKSREKFADHDSPSAIYC